MDTQEIGGLVSQVLSTLKQPWPLDITNQVFLAIEAKPDWLRRYYQLNRAFGVLTLNASIGRHTKELTGLRTVGRSSDRKSHLIMASYALLGR